MHPLEVLSKAKAFATGVELELPRDEPPDPELAKLIGAAPPDRRADRHDRVNPGPSRSDRGIYSGKSTLLNALVGWADLLPTNSVPSTGNVTVIRFTQHEGRETTRLDKVEVVFLTQEEDNECFSRLLSRVKGAAGTDRAVLDVVGKLDARQPEARARRGLVQEYGSFPLRCHLRRLRRGIAPVRLGIGGSSRGHPRSQDRQQFGRPDHNRETARRLTPADYGPGDRPGSVGNSPAPDFLEPNQFRSSFPLIRRVLLDVRIAPEVWDLSKVRATNQFELVDFPGLRAADSAARDEYLLERELPELQTLLVLFEGGKPFGPLGQEVIGKIDFAKAGVDRRAMLLAGLGNFDKLQLHVDSYQAIEELSPVRGRSARPHPPPFTKPR